MSTAVTIFTPTTNPMMTLPAATPRLLWQTTVYYGAGTTGIGTTGTNASTSAPSNERAGTTGTNKSNNDYLLAAFYEDATQLYYLNLLPPTGILTHLIEGIWVKTEDGEATLDDVFCHFFGPNAHADIRQDALVELKLPYEYVRHLISINELTPNMEFYVIIK
jgi:hypothetical protein